MMYLNECRCETVVRIGHANGIWTQNPKPALLAEIDRILLYLRTNLICVGQSLSDYYRSKNASCNTVFQNLGDSGRIPRQNIPDS